MKYIKLALFIFGSFFAIGIAVSSIQESKTLEYRYGLKLTLEKIHQDGIVDAGIERFQFRDRNGDIVAYTPTRITGIPFCINKNMCWVFMWKTVYPLPAIFKFNPDSLSWTHDPDPPVVYSRRGPAGEGFTEKFNPFFGVFGLILFLICHIWFFCCVFFVTSILFIQINHYRDMPEIHKAWVRRLLSFVLTLAHLPFPFSANPFLLTAALMLILAIMGMIFAGIPLGITLIFIIMSFYLCAVTATIYRRSAG